MQQQQQGQPCINAAQVQPTAAAAMHPIAPRNVNATENASDKLHCTALTAFTTATDNHSNNTPTTKTRNAPASQSPVRPAWPGAVGVNGRRRLFKTQTSQKSNKFCLYYANKKLKKTVEENWLTQTYAFCVLKK